MRDGESALHRKHDGRNAEFHCAKNAIRALAKLMLADLFPPVAAKNPVPKIKNKYYITTAYGIERRLAPLNSCTISGA